MIIRGSRGCLLRNQSHWCILHKRSPLLVTLFCRRIKQTSDIEIPPSVELHRNIVKQNSTAEMCWENYTTWYLCKSPTNLSVGWQYGLTLAYHRYIYICIFVAWYALKSCFLEIVLQKKTSGIPNKFTVSVKDTQYGFFSADTDKINSNMHVCVLKKLWACSLGTPEGKKGWDVVCKDGEFYIP